MRKAFHKEMKPAPLAEWEIELLGFDKKLTKKQILDQQKKSRARLLKANSKSAKRNGKNNKFYRAGKKSKRAIKRELYQQ